MKTILFQGDSITDVRRNREDPTNLGQGYANMVSGRLGLDYPGEYLFLNRGIGGNRIVDIYARMKSDIINLKPDYMSLLIGINDVWHEIRSENGVSAQKFKKIYGMLLEELLEALPNLKIILIEPFVLKGTATEENLDRFREEVALRIQAVQELAKQFDLPCIALQEDLDKLCGKASEDYWLRDGVHPNVYFHQYIADRWIETFKAMQ